MIKNDEFISDAEQGSPRTGEPAQKKSRKKTGNDQGGVAAGSTATGSAAGASAGGAAAPADLEQLVQENIDAEAEVLDGLAKALAEAEELRDRYLRLKAEWDNYRKRTETERAEERSRATQRLVEKLLPVMDDMERALEHSDTATEESLKEGIAQVHSKLQGVLLSEGVQAIDPKGSPFDANLHCAVSIVEDAQAPDETVLEVFQKGYAMGSRVLRPASVVVSSK
ncbi:MAG: nucleotide exchange factor GrpE [Coriobacteriales bacterium]|jgi:molecular chaperone GrpE|nr:nucleotide exchange factor GrpE [Coriobacteriales bacterium]